MSLLVVDSGNSRIKWGLHDGKDWTARGSSAQRDLHELACAWKTMAPASAIGSNVAGPEIANRLEGLLPELEFTWIKSEASQCGVSNGYSDPSRLGTDRWAALIGARSQLSEGGIVVGLGTALTIDLLDREGRFEGGCILPGLQPMLDALKRSTRLDPECGDYAFPAKNTGDGVMTGAVLALSGAIEKASRLRGNPECLLFGGDAEFLLPHLDVKARAAENLVLDGLVLIARASS